MTKRIFILALLLLTAAVWWRMLSAERPVKLDQQQRRESLTPIRKGKG